MGGGEEEGVRGRGEGEDEDHTWPRLTLEGKGYDLKSLMLMLKRTARAQLDATGIA